MTERQFTGWWRRDVLALGSAGLAAAAVTGPRSAAWSASLDPMPAGENAIGALQLAYVAGRRDHRGEGAPPVAGLADARALPSGDRALAAEGVRLSIRGGFDPSEIGAHSLTSLSVDVDFRPFQPSIFHAWHFEDGPVPGMAAPVGLTVPVTDAGLHLIVETRKDGADSVLRHRLRLAVGAEPGLPKLRPGIYLLPWPHLRSAWAGCYWCAQTASLVRRDWRRSEMVPADVPHLVLSVERANAGAA